ncbi:hypothetical protein CPC08DRAFT_591470, partial [Agrocybe pediades]
FGLYRVYTSYPASQPDEAQALDDICDAPGLAVSSGKAHSDRWFKAMGLSRLASTAKTKIFGPFLNATVFRLMHWFYSGSNLKTQQSLDSLVKDVLLAEDFDVSHLKGFSAAKELRRLDESDESPISGQDGWKRSSVKIRLPAEKHQNMSEDDAPIMEVPNTIKTVFQDRDSTSFHYTPFRLFWKPTPESPPERVITELYNSEAFIEEHERIQKQPPEPGPHYETAIAAIMLWSDSTHLANFGTASMWPIYMFFGNESKYSRAKPSNFSAHHIAYLPSLSSTLQDLYRKIFDGLSASAATITHLRRELMHAIWLLLLDEEFMRAYEHGIVILCSDGITRRIFPRFFTYSADYPEKILLATIRFLAQCPCPRCFIQKRFISGLGTKADYQRRSHTREDTPQRQQRVEISRDWIYVHGRGVKSKAVEDLLKERSEVPTRNAFSERLGKFGFNFHNMFVPDLLHEFELGVWKATFTHLLRILYAAADDCIQELNWRYRRISTFGRSTIRRFSNNASGMKKLAARDFEDLLQCAIPVFEGILPTNSHNNHIMDLLFVLCTWHALAKLRLHTASTLNGLQESTKSLGQLLRDFVRKVCSKYKTKELPREEAARTRRRAAAASKGKAVRKDNGQKGAKKLKLFNLSTFKLHALGYYVPSIIRSGTSESYSTQRGEFEHRRLKRFYARTNKGHVFELQLSKQERRERELRRIGRELEKAKKPAKESITVPFSETGSFSATSPLLHHEMSKTKSLRLNLFQWLHENKGDSALQGFLPKLKDHLLCRLLGLENLGAFTDEQRNTVKIEDDSLFRHKVLRVNYTTYDLRRSQDSINPRTHPDIMTLSYENASTPNSHPFWYARVLGIFHVNVRHTPGGRLSNTERTEAQRIEFLWVRWFRLDTTHVGGWNTRRLHRIGFVPSDSLEDEAFGFIDPAVVLRAVHLIPAFAHGRTSRLLISPSIARFKFPHEDQGDEDTDWRYLYVNMFVDRDMVMRFLGGGVGHK